MQMNDEDQERLKRLVVAFENRAEANLASMLKDFRNAYVDLTQDERRVLKRWAGNTSLFEEDASSIRVDLHLQLKFSAPSDDDKPRAKSVSVFSEEKTVEVHLNLPSWLDSLID